MRLKLCMLSPNPQINVVLQNKTKIINYNFLPKPAIYKDLFAADKWV